MTPPSAIGTLLPLPKISNIPFDPDQPDLIYSDADCALRLARLAKPETQDMVTPQDPNKIGTALAAQFEHLLDMQTAMCVELEKIADGLPKLNDRHGCLTLAQRMLPLIKRAHQFEEKQVWPVLSRQKTGAFALRETLDRLSYEHWGDEDFAEQVFHLLRDYVQSPLSEKADSLAWTLRGFFQNMQRHIAFEREFLLPLVSMDTR